MRDPLTERALQRAQGFEVGSGRDMRPLATALVILGVGLIAMILVAGIR